MTARCCVVCGVELDPGADKRRKYCSVACNGTACRRRNPGAQSIANRRYYERNRDRMLERSRRYRAENPDRAAARVRSYHARNRESVLASHRAWVKRNPEKCRNYQGRRRANERYSVPPKALRRIALHYRNRCAYCGGGDGTWGNASATDLQWDHVVPISRGGRHSEGNLVPACRSCNLSKKDKYVAEWRFWKARRAVEEVRV